MATLNYVQSQTLYQAGSGSLIGATTVTLTSLTDIYGNVLTMADFGAKGFFTCEPDTTNEESGTFTGITANANGTYTLTGVKTSLGKSPYTETSGMVRLHSGGTSVVLTDTVAFWNTFANKQNDEVVTGRWGSATIPSAATDYTNKNYVDGVAIAGAPDASATVKGISRLTQSPNRTLGVVTVTIATPAVATLNAHGLTLNDTVQFTTTGALPTGITASTNYFVIAAGLTASTFQIATTLGGTAINTSGSQSGVHTLIRTTPYVIADTDYRMLTNSFGVDSGTANAHVVTLPYTSPSVLISGTLVSYIALNTNTLAVTANVSGTGVKTIKKLAGATDLAAGDIVAGMVVELEYSATSGFWQMLNPIATVPVASISFGDGSDGDVTISGNTSLTRDMFYNNLTIQTGAVLSPKGFRIFVKNTLTFQGTGLIASNGGAGGAGVGSITGVSTPTGGTAGAADYTAGSLPAPVAGQVGGIGGNAGAAGVVGTTGASAAKSIGSAGVAGGTGSIGGTAGAGTGPGAASAGGAAGTQTGTVFNRLNSIQSVYFLLDTQPSVAALTDSAGSGSGGGGGAGRSSNGATSGAGGGGGGSGATGGVVCVFASSVITVNGNDYIQSKGGVGGVGGAGGNSTAFNDGGGSGGGGGAGGSGGVVTLVYRSLTGSGTVSVAGGAAGTGGALGLSNGTGTNGTAGANGTAGLSGIVYTLVI